MKNLEQIRAANALPYSTELFLGKNSGDIVKKIPTMIRENGLIGALAFAIENSGSGYEKTFIAIIKHLSDPQINKSNAGKLKDNLILNAFLCEVVKVSSPELISITAESLAYLNYLRRFAKKQS